MSKIEIQIKRLPGTSDLPLPAYQTADAVGMDLHAATTEPVVLAPGQVTVCTAGIVFRAEQRHMVTRGQLATELGRVDLGARAMPRQEIMDGVQDAHPSILP